jgi:hypothetical protein
MNQSDDQGNAPDSSSGLVLPPIAQSPAVWAFAALTAAVDRAD